MRPRCAPATRHATGADSRHGRRGAPGFVGEQRVDGLDLSDELIDLRSSESSAARPCPFAPHRLAGQICP